MNSFTPSAFGLATAVKEFSAAASSPKLLARETDDGLLAGSRLLPVGILSTLVGRDRAWHIDEMFTPFCLAMAALGLLSGRIVVLCPHGMLNRWALRNGRAGMKRAALKALNALARIGRLYVHTLNPAEARKARALFPNARLVEVIPNGVPADILAVRDHLPLRHARTGPVVVGYMSRIAPNKNQMAMIDLAAHLRRSAPDAYADMVFRIDGQVEDAAYADTLATEIARQSLGDKVTLGGPVAFEDRARCLWAYDIFFFPSKSEGMPNVILEAMALGVPPLASYRSSCGFVRDYGGRVYRSIESAAEVLPTDRCGLADWRVDTEAFVRAYGIEKLKSFFGSLRP